MQTLAGLLALLGLQLRVLGDQGAINLPFESSLVRFASQQFLPAGVAYALALLAPALVRVGQRSAATPAVPRPACRPRR